MNFFGKEEIKFNGKKRGLSNPPQRIEKVKKGCIMKNYWILGHLEKLKRKSDV